MREKIRTPDTLVRSQVLYPAELHAHIYNCYDIIMSTARDRNRTGATQIISLINQIARKDLRYDIQY